MPRLLSTYFFFTLLKCERDSTSLLSTVVWVQKWYKKFKLLCPVCRTNSNLNVIIKYIKVLFKGLGTSEFQI